MEVKSGYKQTEVGVIPEDWAVTELGDCLVGHPQYGINAAAVPYSDRLPVYIRITDISEDGRFRPDERVSVRSKMSKNYFLDAGDIVFARTGASVGKSYRYDPDDGPLVYAGFLIRVRPSPDRLLSEFAAAFFMTGRYWRWVRLMSTRSGQPGINGREYAQMPIPLPPVREQRAIATALNDADALLVKLDQLIAKKRDVTQAAMQQLLTGQVRLPGFTSEWETRRLGDHVTFLRNGANSRAELLPEGPVRYLHYGDIHASAEVYLSVGNLPSLPEVKAARLDRLQDGDLILADASEDLTGVAKSVEMRGLGDVEVVPGQHTIAARFDQSVLANGFKGLLQHCPPFARHLRRLAAGTKVYATNRAHIASVEMPLPPVPEQVAIAAVIADMDTELQALEGRRNKTRDIKQAMMQELLTGRTRLVAAGGEDA